LIKWDRGKERQSDGDRYTKRLKDVQRQTLRERLEERETA